MKTEAQDIELLARAIMAESRDEAEQLYAEAREKADAIRKRAQEQAESERKTILARAKEDADRLRSQSSATTQLKARSTQLDEREKILNGVFDEVRKQLDAVKKRPDYGEIATMLAREALSQLRATEAEVRVDETTQKALKLDDLSKELNGKFNFGEKLEDGTGVVVSAASGKLHYDNTLETRLSRLQGSLRSSVYKLLMGEKV
ncbi:MAG TPA: V-type ATP synthase subunit E family protein [Anaerolineales bacterium]|nr:V-type ATP synthase subunit E family protein [Anaerolineales bacterium]